MLIHAYRRKEAVTVDTGAGHVEFKPNAEGEVVGEANEAQAAVLLNITEGYKAHGKAPAAAKASKSASVPAPAPAPAPVPPAAGGKDGAEDSETDDADRGAGKPFYLLGETAEDDIDLGPMDMKELKAFAKANTFTVKRGITEEALRKELFDTFNPAE